MYYFLCQKLYCSVCQVIYIYYIYRELFIKYMFFFLEYWVKQLFIILTPIGLKKVVYFLHSYIFKIFPLWSTFYNCFLIVLVRYSLIILLFFLRNILKNIDSRISLSLFSKEISKKISFFRLTIWCYMVILKYKFESYYNEP